MPDCNHNIDPQKLVREGTSQDQRPFPALDPAYAPVSEQTPAHTMVFAQAYTAYLRYFDASDVPVDNWQRFFGQDVSVQLAIAAVQEVDFYKTRVLESFRYLDNRDNLTNDAALKKHLGNLFANISTLAHRLDVLKETLPLEIGLRATLSNLIQTQLAPGFGRLIAYYRAGNSLGLMDETLFPAGLNILGSPVMKFGDVKSIGFSKDWITNASSDWAIFEAGITGDVSVYGSGTAFEKINHLATHNLFTSVFDQFLKVYARIVTDAKKNLEATFTNWDSHEPHYTLFLAFLRLFEYARAEMNTLTGRHLDFYYKDILRLQEKSAQPGHAHLLVELAKHATTHELPHGSLFKAGKDADGKDAFFASDRDFVANQAKVVAMKTIYRHGSEEVGNGTDKAKQVGRLYASPIANSGNGIGAELTNTDQSWHPFYNKDYDDGLLQQINMPTAEVGFAVASHYLWLAEGERTITLEFEVNDSFLGLGDQVVCLLSTEKGWLEKMPDTARGILPKLVVKLSGDDPAVTPYLAKTHGYGFDTNVPVLLVKFRHDPANTFLYPAIQELTLKKINLTVAVKNLKTLAVSNDFGPVDTSKPFQPFGATPVAGSGLMVGAKEVFQKKLDSGTVDIVWQNAPAPFAGSSPQIRDTYLNAGQLKEAGGTYSFANAKNTINLKIGTGNATIDLPDFSENEVYNTTSRHGFVRLSLTDDFGQPEYQTALLSFLTTGEPKNLGSHPQGPFASTITMDYTATQVIALESADAVNFQNRPAKFFHIAPFGHAERHPALSGGNSITLFPQFQHTEQGIAAKHEAEFYLGIAGLKPPQNLALLFQVAEGTADPLSQKPIPHLHWSYLRDNAWITFEKDAVEDLTGELTRSGIITLAMPRDISKDNTLLPAGMHWLRMAVETESDTVCRLIKVAAQALKATFINRDNDPTYSAVPLVSGTIAKLDQPDAAVKKIEQPFATFGGRGQEAPNAFYTRVSERLRHKERAIALWDYERLVLEAFPQVYKVKCLNHTQYEPNLNGDGIYRELAAGHVTIVTIPNQQSQNLRDPLRPYTSLGLLLEIEAFLKQRLTCFAKLHVKNPQFEEVRLDFQVKFHPGFDETYYTNQLKREITRFLSPWAFPGGGSPSFGGKIYKSVLINFVEERPFVDFVTDVKLFHNEGTIDLNEVEGSTAVSVLVSVPEEQHGIKSITVAAVSEQVTSDPCPCQT
jgi:hypothetical protein